MNKFLKLTLFPLALTFSEGCAHHLHNISMNLRHDVERVIKDPPKRKIVAHGFDCDSSTNKAIRKARNEAERELKEKRIKGTVETSEQEEKLENQWLKEHDPYSLSRYRSRCVLAWVYEEDSPPPLPQENETDIPELEGPPLPPEESSDTEEPVEMENNIQ